jgi:hypothetical protein
MPGRYLINIILRRLKTQFHLKAFKLSLPADKIERLLWTFAAIAIDSITIIAVLLLL